ncbi:MAG TPA: DNA polymerase I [Gammaproteobacteria bacterium]|nr:DNA polymerase I [Gammaproteobacteria bacterium]HIL18542.1 DNA polymerase I [Gammaproteobacteria bacterium]
MTKKLVLVDGSSYLYRAYHAMPDLTTSSGETTGAIYGVINMLRRQMKEHPSDYLVVIFDAPGKTFRDDIYPAYKANRPPMPNDLRSQIEPTHDVIQAMGIPLLSVAAVEADDVIGTLSTTATAMAIDTDIMSGDKDFAQLVGKRVRLIDSMKGETYDTAGIKVRFGVEPEQMVDYLTLVGDAVDNVPGVPKVGPKTAMRWLETYRTLDNLVAHAEEIKGKVGDNLRQSLEQLALSRELVTIKTDVELDVTPKDLMQSTPDEDRLRALFSRLEFKTWLSELGGTNSVDTHLPEAEYTIILDEKSLRQWIKRLSRAGVFSLDTETTSLDTLCAELVGISFTDRVGEGAYLPLAHDYVGAPLQVSLDYALTCLRPLLEDPKIGKIGQNLKYDRSVLQNYDIDLKGIRFDTMLESYVLNSTGSRHDMSTLALKYLGYKVVKYEEVAGSGKSQVSFSQVDVEQAGHYAAEDADIAMRLHEKIYPQFQSEPALRSVLETIEIPLVPVLSRVERNGVRVDCDMLSNHSIELGERIAQIEKKAHAAAGVAFNIASPRQIQEVLFEKLDLPIISKTPKGQPSTAENVLQELAEDHELPQLILQYRSLSKLKSTYTDKLPELVSPVTGRVHTSYHQASVATGRLSSSNPNLQNIPVRTEEGRRIRQAFIPDPGYVLVAADYSQIELRIMAHLSADEGLLSAFADDADIHRATAAEVFSIKPSKVTDDQRRSAKAINFGLIYGMSAFGLAKQLGIGRIEAQDYIDLYFSRYPGVHAFMENTRVRAREQRFVETVFGRRLYLNDMGSSNHARRQAAERAAINAPMQGTAADLIKLAMLAVDGWITEKNLQMRMIMQVHDELVLEVSEDDVDQARSMLNSLMTSVAELAVPLKVEVNAGKNWAMAHA